MVGTVSKKTRSANVFIVRSLLAVVAITLMAAAAYSQARAWSLYTMGGGQTIGFISFGVVPPGRDRFNTFASEAECEAFKARFKDALSGVQLYILTNHDGSMDVAADTPFGCHK